MSGIDKNQPATAGLLDEGVNFETVKQCELTTITESRQQRQFSTQSVSQNLIGLAFSGGGIRSATFNLGVLQSLATQGCLTSFDYLSTVSGGGYIGSWLAAWIKREGLNTVGDQLAATSQTEPATISWLRAYSNYLTPRLGIFSGDTLAFVSIYLRNLSLNLVIIIAGLATLLLLPRWLIWAEMTLITHSQWPMVATVLAMLLVLWALALVFLNLRYIQKTSDPMTVGHHINKTYPIPPFYVKSVSGLIVFPLILGMGILASHPATNTTFSNIYQKYLAIVYQYFAQGHSYSFDVAINANVFYFPLLTLLLTLIVTLGIGLLGRSLSDQQREWLSRLGGQVLKWTLLGVLVLVMAFYSPIVMAVLGMKIQALLASGWLTSTIWGLLIGKSDATGSSSSDNPDRQGNKKQQVVTKIAPYAFSLGLLSSLALGVHQLLLHLTYVSSDLEGSFFGQYIGQKAATFSAAQQRYFAQVEHCLTGDLLVCTIGLITVAVIFSYRVDINEFSMHLLYRNRLVRAYLGASNPYPNPNPFTGFDSQDDLKLSLFTKETNYQGPYPIINATLNLVGKQDLAFQDRKAASFTFTPDYCGYDFVAIDRGQNNKLENKRIQAYRETVDYGGGVTLGTALAISGAAVSPNMGYHSSFGLSFLMTIFNVRLGWWLGNPKSSKWKHAGPQVGLGYLFSELTGSTTDEKNYIYLSDGGHFDNLGIYELVRRQCKYIVACDAIADANMKFNDLSRAIRHCYIDFGVKIDIDLSSLMKNSETGYSQTHCAIGVIAYPNGELGTLIYLKASLTGNETADILNYAKEHPSFPHEATVDQWFSEAQFESYRKLGYGIAQEVFSDLSTRINAPVDPKISELPLNLIKKSDDGAICPNLSINPEINIEKHWSELVKSLAVKPLQSDW